MPRSVEGQDEPLSQSPFWCLCLWGPDLPSPGIAGFISDAQTLLMWAMGEWGSYGGWRRERSGFQAEEVHTGSPLVHLNDSWWLCRQACVSVAPEVPGTKGGTSLEPGDRHHPSYAHRGATEGAQGA